jgi:hypothetical protein
MRDIGQTALGGREALASQPDSGQLRTGTYCHVAEVEYRFAAGRLGVIYLLVQALGLSDLSHGVLGEALAAELGEKIRGPKLVEQRVLVHDAVGGRAEQFQHGRVVFEKQFHEAA